MTVGAAASSVVGLGGQCSVGSVCRGGRSLTKLLRRGYVQAQEKRPGHRDRPVWSRVVRAVMVGRERGTCFERHGGHHAHGHCDCRGPRHRHTGRVGLIGKSGRGQEDVGREKTGEPLHTRDDGVWPMGPDLSMGPIRRVGGLACGPMGPACLCVGRVALCVILRPLGPQCGQWGHVAGRLPGRLGRVMCRRCT